MGIIGFRKAKCKDCYKCVRLCPVKAIRTQDEHVQFVGSDCILCGQCLESCPQDAIMFFSDLERVKRYVHEGVETAVSIDPSYLGVFGDTEIGTGQFRDALSKLGFTHIRETAEGAVHITREYERLMQENQMENIITTSCPTINEMVEKYYPDIVPYMAPVVSPAIAHGKMLKHEYGKQVKVIYIGPCIGKTREALQDGRTSGYVDAVIDFVELRQWLVDEGIDLRSCEFKPRECPNAKVNGLYATTGGILTSIKADQGFGSYNRLYVDGIDACEELFQCILNGEIKNCFIEVESCVGGCINGPMTGGQKSDRFKARIYEEQKIIHEFPEVVPLAKEISLDKVFKVSENHGDKQKDMPTEEELRYILKKIGKDNKEQELNCGACGFSTCREKAIAVYQHKAQVGYCLPYMYQQAKSVADVILSVMPTMLLMVDRKFKIIEFNKAAEIGFKVSREKAIGTYLYDLIDIDNFKKVFDDKESIIDKQVNYEYYKLRTSQNIVYMKEQDAVLGLIRDITAEQKQQERRSKTKMEAVEIAQKIIDKQMMVAQEIAGLLGETTAETKMTLTKLRDSMLIDGDEQE